MAVNTFNLARQRSVAVYLPFTSLTRVYHRCELARFAVCSGPWHSFFPRWFAISSTSSTTNEWTVSKNLLADGVFAFVSHGHACTQHSTRQRIHQALTWNWKNLRAMPQRPANCFWSSLPKAKGGMDERQPSYLRFEQQGWWIFSLEEKKGTPPHSYRPVWHDHHRWTQHESSGQKLAPHHSRR